MAGLGISIYPEHSTKGRDLEYIHLAGKIWLPENILHVCLVVGMKNTRRTYGRIQRSGGCGNMRKGWK